MQLNRYQCESEIQLIHPEKLESRGQSFGKRWDEDRQEAVMSG